jgi:hypothetical protein
MNSNKMVQLLVASSGTIQRFGSTYFTQSKQHSLDLTLMRFLQIRRSGNNAEGRIINRHNGIQTSEFDFEGWHADPTSPEFTVWEILMSKSRSIKTMFRRTGTSQNKMKLVLLLRSSVVMCPESKTLTWHFNAPMVHDFTWVQIGLYSRCGERT